MVWYASLPGISDSVIQNEVQNSMHVNANKVEVHSSKDMLGRVLLYIRIKLTRRGLYQDKAHTEKFISRLSSHEKVYFKIKFTWRVFISG